MIAVLVVTITQILFACGGGSGGGGSDHQPNPVSPTMTLDGDEVPSPLLEEKGSWERIPPFEKLSGRRSSMAAWNGSEFIVLGGSCVRTDDSSGCDWYPMDGGIYSPDSGEWTYMEPAPLEQEEVSELLEGILWPNVSSVYSHQAMVATSEKVYWLLSGKVNKDDLVYFLAYDLKKKAWQQLAPPPAVKVGSLARTLYLKRDRLYSVASSDWEFSPLKIYLYEYHAANNEWQVVEQWEQDKGRSSDESSTNFLRSENALHWVRCNDDYVNSDVGSHYHINHTTVDFSADKPRVVSEDVGYIPDGDYDVQRSTITCGSATVGKRFSATDDSLFAFDAIPDRDRTGNSSDIVSMRGFWMNGSREFVADLPVMHQPGVFENFDSPILHSYREHMVNFGNAVFSDEKASLTPVNRGYVYSKPENKWYVTAAENAPAGRIDHTVLATERGVFVWGGWSAVRKVVWLTPESEPIELDVTVLKDGGIFTLD